MSPSIPSQSNWARLLRIANHLIAQVNADACILDDWTLGGGTAMMLQIDHRESRDIDIFIADPQILPFFDPATHDFEFATTPVDYQGDGRTFLKIAFEGIGEIDFIVAPSLTKAPTVKREIENASILLETVPEIVAKKVFHRGASIKPRDIFDIAAAATVCRGQVVDALREYPDRVSATLVTMNKLQPAFVKGAISQLMIRERFRRLTDTAFDDARDLLRSVVG